MARVRLDDVRADQVEFEFGGKVYVGTRLLDFPISKAKEVEEISTRLNDADNDSDRYAAMYDFIRFCVPNFEKATMKEMSPRQVTQLLDLLGESQAAQD